LVVESPNTLHSCSQYTCTAHTKRHNSRACTRAWNIITMPNHHCSSCKRSAVHMQWLSLSSCLLLLCNSDPTHETTHMKQARAAPCPINLQQSFTQTSYMNLLWQEWILHIHVIQQHTCESKRNQRETNTSRTQCRPLCTAMHSHHGSVQSHDGTMHTRTTMLSAVLQPAKDHWKTATHHVCEPLRQQSARFTSKKELPTSSTHRHTNYVTTPAIPSCAARFDVTAPATNEPQAKPTHHTPTQPTPRHAQRSPVIALCQHTNPNSNTCMAGPQLSCFHNTCTRHTQRCCPPTMP
jgi:hypothetical protein